MRAKVDIDNHSRPRATGSQTQRRCPSTAIDSTRAARLATVNVTTTAAPTRPNATRIRFRWRPDTDAESDFCGSPSRISARWAQTMPSPSLSGNIIPRIGRASTVLAISFTRGVARPQGGEPWVDSDANVRGNGLSVSHDLLNRFPYYLIRARDTQDPVHVSL
jgi:hypothetical protein